MTKKRSPKANRQFGYLWEENLWMQFFAKGNSKLGAEELQAELYRDTV